ncbi:carboxypeptidase-like regulatory domain-containing protein [Paucibacter sp. O1-1]|nr:carboxypeptidase-like regulatory domain-containing protein [Paucibacter sp. O1-1]MDA3831686.1 carboxypeptidase-like regulatory domain-containing protein [Paucibacter sp. O1-1]
MLLFLLCQNAFSQDITISGKISDESTGSSLPGASVTLKGSTTIGVTTDADGKYTIKVPSSAQTIVISFIGYSAKEVAIGNRTVIDVTLASDVSALEEVIVTGYGSQSKRGHYWFGNHCQCERPSIGSGYHICPAAARPRVRVEHRK